MVPCPKSTRQLRHPQLVPPRDSKFSLGGRTSCAPAGRRSAWAPALLLEPSPASRDSTRRDPVVHCVECTARPSILHPAIRAIRPTRLSVVLPIGGPYPSNRSAPFSAVATRGLLGSFARSPTCSSVTTRRGPGGHVVFVRLCRSTGHRLRGRYRLGL